jgi:hypothetical protein
MFGLLLEAAFAVGVVVFFWYAARWAFARDRESTYREDLADLRDEADRFLHDPMRFRRRP